MTIFVAYPTDSESAEKSLDTRPTYHTMQLVQYFNLRNVSSTNIFWDVLVRKPATTLRYIGQILRRQSNLPWLTFKQSSPPWPKTLCVFEWCILARLWGFTLCRSRDSRFLMLPYYVVGHLDMCDLATIGCFVSSAGEPGGKKAPVQSRESKEEGVVHEHVQILVRHYTCQADLFACPYLAQLRLPGTTCETTRLARKRNTKRPFLRRI